MAVAFSMSLARVSSLSFSPLCGSWLLHVFLFLLDVVHGCCWCFFLMSFLAVAGVSSPTCGS